jgi:hypothetical protein
MEEPDGIIRDRTKKKTRQASRMERDEEVPRTMQRKLTLYSRHEKLEEYVHNGFEIFSHL